ncbi:MAG TPA: TetR/AcrR family transcriptional regulator [Anaerolineales bacterium]|nr:TetR/AcrR family transcriptional regulator [Anaerolineales bacterium]
MDNHKPDRRSQRTRRLLGTAFVQLLREKGYSAITVNDLIERANVGRSTFYSHYRNKEDLFVSELDRVIEALSHHSSSRAEMPYFPSLGLFQHVGEEYELYKALLWTPGIDLFIRHMQTSLSQRIGEALENSGRKFEIPAPILSNYMAGSFLTLLKWWLENKRIQTAEEMDRIFKSLILSGIAARQDH